MLKQKFQTMIQFSTVREQAPVLNTQAFGDRTFGLFFCIKTF